MVAANVHLAGTSPAPREPTLSVPLAPSRLEAYAPDETGEPIPATPSCYRPANEEPPALPPAAQSTDHRFLRGTLTHALLQHLPTLPASGWPKAAAVYNFMPISRPAMCLDLWANHHEREMKKA